MHDSESVRRLHFSLLITALTNTTWHVAILFFLSFFLLPLSMQLLPVYKGSQEVQRSVQLVNVKSFVRGIFTPLYLKMQTYILNCIFRLSLCWY